MKGSDGRRSKDSPLGRLGHRQLTAQWRASTRLAALACVLLALALAVACGNNNDLGARGLQPDGTYIIVGTEFAFEPDTIEIPVNEEAVIEFRNLGTVDHDLVIEEFGVATGSMRIGSKKTVRFTPTEIGEFDLICSIPGHPEAGMTGTVSVVESPVQTVAQG